VKSKSQGHEQSLEALNQQLWEAGVSITKGQSVPRSTSVLQMQANPASEHFELRRQELNRLKAENLALVGRLREVEMEKGIGDREGLIPRESWDNLSVEKEELLSTIAQKELRLLRLKQVRLNTFQINSYNLIAVTCCQVFNAKAGEFREAVSSILGYRLAFQSTRVRLTSMFDVAASMVFDSISKAESKGLADVGTMKLISLGDGEVGPPKMRELMQFWVYERNSIPCFLAALTLECYEGMMRTQNTNQMLDSSSMDLDMTNR
jgi:mitotic spindle assembly checkpoint protein MAD1